MDISEKLLLENKAWAKDIIESNKDFFEIIAKGQSPNFLWIGCSDSRVLPNEITNTDMGELFVHRNIANLVVQGDLNLLSVLEYAVDVLKVKHIVVCGHHGCGGVKAALDGASIGLIDQWILNIRNLYLKNKEIVDQAGDEEMKVNKLAEINVVEQVHNLTNTSIIQKAWKTRQIPTIHGWIYNMKNGRLKELYKVDYNK